MTQDLAFLNDLSPTQEHFLKKFLVEACLKQELHYLSKPHCLEYIGPPFRTNKVSAGTELPLLRHFFSTFVASFPFITMNPKKDQIAFWRDTVQPFVESFNNKRVSNAAQRRTNTTKRHQVNRQLLRTLLLFYNSMLSSKSEVQYLNTNHLKPSDQGKLDRISKNPASVKMGLDAFQAPRGIDDYAKMVYTNNYNLNIVAVDVFHAKSPHATAQWSFNPLRLMGTAKKPPSTVHCVYILQVTRRTLAEGKYTYASHFIPRSYSEFKALESALKSSYPGLMSAEIHAMPTKISHDSGVRTDGSVSARISTENSANSTSIPSADTNSANITSANITSANTTSASVPSANITSGRESSGTLHSPNSANISTSTNTNTNSASTKNSASFKSARSRDHSHKYYGEKLRLALRGYINTLLHKPEIANCKAFLNFIDDPAKNFEALSDDQLQDYHQRMELEKTRLATQEEFQNNIAKIVYDLTGNFERFKKDLIEDPHQLTAIFSDIGVHSKPEQMSPLVTTFIEWCKLEIAATLYQMFLTQDNSSHWLQKCRKFHRVFPYRMCYGILKYTNPVKIMSRMVDLLLMNVPSFGRKSNQANNLLSMIFIMLLDEDLQDFSKERQKLLTTQPLNRPEFKVFFTRIREYVQSADALLEEELQQEKIETEINFFLSVLSSDLIEPRLSESERDTFDSVIIPSHESYKNLSKGNTLDDASVYVSLKQFWQLETRTRDKEIFKQLWKEPELTQLIKKVLTVFYQPLMTVMKKCNVHLVFLDFQRFLDDLLAELTVLDEGDMYFTSSVEMFNRFKKLLDKYEGTFYRFLHDLHHKDDGKLFMNLIAWTESFLVALRTKFTDPKKVQLDFAVMQPTEPIDEDKFRKDLNSRIELILKKRLLLKTCMRNAASTGNAEANKPSEADGVAATQEGKVLSSHQKAIDKQWEKLNSGIFEMSPQELGVSGEDLEEFNLTNFGEKATDSFRSGNRNASVLRQIAELDRLMNDVGDSEIHKLVDPIHAQIKSLIANLGRKTSTS